MFWSKDGGHTHEQAVQTAVRQSAMKSAFLHGEKKHWGDQNNKDNNKNIGWKRMQTHISRARPEKCCKFVALSYILIHHNNTVIRASDKRDFVSSEHHRAAESLIKNSRCDSPLFVSWDSRPSEAASVSVLLVFIPADNGDGANMWFTDQACCFTATTVKLLHYKILLPVG